MDNNSIAKQLSTSKEDILFVEAPAGCGKTYTIAQAIACAANGRHLVLTHTNAGVASIRRKMRDLKVSRALFSIDTIDGFSQKLAVSYPTTSNFVEDMEWYQKRNSALKVIAEPFAKKLLANSFASIYIDEYQDCSLLQHQLILSLSNCIPCRLFGDPLQGIFDFDKKDPAIDWDTDVSTKIKKFATLDTPWRWETGGGSPELGRWLTSIRENLINGLPITIPETVNIAWRELSEPNKIYSCKSKLDQIGSIVAIERGLPLGKDHMLAKKLKGTYHSIEEMEGKDLLEFARKLQQTQGYESATAIIDFAQDCLIGTSRLFGIIKSKIANQKEISTTSKLPGAVQLADTIRTMIQSSSIIDKAIVLKAIENLPNISIARKELWLECKKMLALYLENNSDDLVVVAKKVREQTRIIGRFPEYRLISRVLLVKGLEFDHGIVLDADNLTSKELYVALTRGKRSLVVLSKDRTIAPKASKNTKKITAKRQPALL